MPKRTPKYAHHKPSGQARVRIEGKNYYLGRYDSPESHEQYEQLVARWLGGTLNVDRESLSIARLCILYVDHCRVCYVKDGKQTSEVLATQAALKPLIWLFAREKVSHFGPRKLKLVREDFISRAAARAKVNSHAQRIVRMLKWGVENELVDASVYQSCKAVAGLRRGRSSARDKRWAPNQLRHNAATELRKQFPIETVRTVLGHSTAFTTEIYAELDFETARKVIEKAG